MHFYVISVGFSHIRQTGTRFFFNNTDILQSYRPSGYKAPAEPLAALPRTGFRPRISLCIRITARIRSIDFLMRSRASLFCFAGEVFSRGGIGGKGSGMGMSSGDRLFCAPRAGRGSGMRPANKKSPAPRINAGHAARMFFRLGRRFSVRDCLSERGVMAKALFSGSGECRSRRIRAESFLPCRFACEGRRTKAV